VDLDLLNGLKKWLAKMQDENKPLHPETFFLPPLKMFLAFFDRESFQRELQDHNVRKQKESNGKTVEKLIEKLSEKDE